MQTFTLNPGRCRTVRAFGRNPLVRASDRIEAITLVLAIAIILIAIPVAGTLGTAVYDAQRRAYTGQIQTRHQVTATVIDGSGHTAWPDSTNDAFVRAEWSADGVPHTSTLSWDRDVKAGDRIQIWTDEHGNRVDPLPSSSDAGTQAVLTAVEFWLCVVVGAGAAYALVWWRLGSNREAKWDRELRALINGGGGRANSLW
ncbi:Rv1733c family protein [Mycolicibacterium fortuitum]|uniref:Rv1733c family protein n=1 Tax=Mycolicibacterium fortuitum TaxID=1766 RepID=UPI001CE18D32|nr:hypothetical protein [Mycolicibacterium fortuitum]MCA4727285.1 hypothetical protein [Mycolicibacterium fortuitum]